MHPTVSHRIQSITRNVVISQWESTLWTKLMKNVINSKIKVTQKHLTSILLERLKFRGVGTNEVEHFLKGSRPGSRDVMLKNIMKAKLIDSKREESKARHMHNSQLSYVQRRWGHNTLAMAAFKNAMQTEVNRVWEEGMEKMKEKVKHLTEKWTTSRKEKVSDKWREIAIGDDDLKNIYGEVEQNPVSKYGDVTTTKEEDKILSLPPKFKTFERLTSEKVEHALEVMYAKSRLELRSKNERNGEPWTKDLELADVKERTVFDPESSSMDFSKRRVTDMPTNKRIMVPKPTSTKEVTVFANISNRVLKATDEYIAEKCDDKGNLKVSVLNLMKKKERKVS